MTAETPRRVKYVCPHCGSEDLLKDAWAQWDTENQEWTLGATFDHTMCAECDSKVTPSEVEIP